MSREDAPDQQYRIGSPNDPRQWIYTDGVHLIVDGDRDMDLLHQFAARVGLLRQWFEGDHYDLTTSSAAGRAVASGARLVEMRDVAKLRLKTGHRLRPADWRPTPLGHGAPAYALAVQKHGDVMEFIQGPGNRTWQGTNRNRHRAPEDRRVAGLAPGAQPSKPRVVQQGLAHNPRAAQGPRIVSRTVTSDGR